MVERFSLFTIYLPVLFSFLSDIYMILNIIFKKHYLWVLGLWFTLLNSLHFSVSFKIKNISLPWQFSDSVIPL